MQLQLLSLRWIILFPKMSVITCAGPLSCDDRVCGMPMSVRSCQVLRDVDVLVKIFQGHAIWPTVSTGVKVSHQEDITSLFEIDNIVFELSKTVNIAISRIFRVSEGVNIALYKPTNQSSTFIQNGYVGASHLAVDGGVNNSFYSNSCAHTTQTTTDDAWWEVDFQRQYRIGHIRILNRDTFVERLHDIRIDIYNKKNNAPEKKNCITHKGQAGPGWLQLSCTFPVTGRYLKITKPKDDSSDCLTMCEVEIYEAPAAEQLKCRQFVRMPMTAVSAQRQELLAKSFLHCGSSCSFITGCKGFSVMNKEDGRLGCHILLCYPKEEENLKEGYNTSYFLPSG